MAKKTQDAREGRLVLKEIHFDQVYKRKTMKHNKTACRVCLPMDVLGKTVYVVVPKK